jgi:hypothetical protein
MIRRNNMGKVLQSQKIMFIVCIRVLLMISVDRNMPSAGKADAKEIRIT